VARVADISILIVAFRSADTIRRCLDSIAAQTVQPREVLLLENGSPLGERIEPGNLPDWVRFVPSEENLGFAAGNNMLARLAVSQWLALLNPDAFARPDWIEQLEIATQAYPGVQLFGSTQFCAERPELLDGFGDVYHATGLAYRAGYLRPKSLLQETGEVFAACGAATLVSSELFRHLGGFDESFFCYNEDVDLAFRARLIGHRVVQLRSAEVDHMGYGSSGRRSDFATYYGVRNRMWVFIKNVPGWLFWLLAPVHVFATVCLWGAAARKGQGRAFSRAVLDGLRGWPQMRAARRDVQSKRTVSVLQVGRMMCWNSRNLLTREPDVRPYRPSETTPD
jgi:GT2 family glycosyltransferase